MKNKIVCFGEIRLKQIQCPDCEEWQFDTDKCDCGFDFKAQKKEDTKIEKAPTEYRVQMMTWRKNVPQAIRQRVYERDEFVCQYCGIWCYDSWVRDKNAVTIDHMTPVSGCGSNNEDNLVTCCSECNSIKNNRRFNTFEEAREYIIKRKKDEYKI